MKKEYTQRTARLIGQDKVDELDTKKVLIFGVGGVGRQAQHRPAGRQGRHGVLELAQTTQCGGVVPQGEAPDRQLARRIAQFERADAGVIVVRERQPLTQIPALPACFIRKPRQQPLICNNHLIGDETQLT